MSDAATAAAAADDDDSNNNDTKRSGAAGSSGQDGAAAAASSKPATAGGAGSAAGAADDGSPAADRGAGTYYAHYRASTAGIALEDELDDMLSNGRLTEQQAEVVRAQFDRAMAHALAHRVRAHASLRGRLVHYRLCDNVWTFLVRNGVLRLEGERRADERHVLESLRVERADADGSGEVADAKAENGEAAAAAQKRPESNEGAVTTGLSATQGDEGADGPGGKCEHVLSSDGGQQQQSAAATATATAAPVITNHYVHVDLLRMICTALSEEDAGSKSMSGSSRRKRTRGGSGTAVAATTTTATTAAAADRHGRARTRGRARSRGRGQPRLRR